MKILILEGFSIFDQLQLEESLLRTQQDDYCLINSGSHEAIVMGMSAHPDQLICRNRFSQHPVPLIRRYSGGGTVVVDENTLFLSWIMNHRSIGSQAYPKEIMKWNAGIVQSLFMPLPVLLKQNDYSIDEYKCGGNAQYLIKNRFVHHTSFLWDYQERLMDYLLMPPKQPEYRANREHERFLKPLKHFFISLKDLKRQITERVHTTFNPSVVDLNDLKSILSLPHRRSTRVETW